jgi:HTH-type transcriptional regulator / antitoxin HigA
MKFAETFPPGEFLREELEARNWNQTEFSEIIGRPVKMVNELLLGKRAITPETAIQLGDALGTGPELWMNLESQYQLSKVARQNNAVARKAKLYEKFPVREMVKRGWIGAAESIDVLEQQFLRFFGLKSIDDPLCIPAHAAKRSSEAVTALQLAWLIAARRLALAVMVPRYRSAALRDALPRIHALMSAPEEARHVARILNECGVRFVVVEAMPASKIDGACFWLDDDQPAIAISTRLDRIDNFWFVLRHEIEHVLCEHGKQDSMIFDEDLADDGAENQVEEERIANEAASVFPFGKDEIDGYIARVQPYYFSEQKVLNFSARLGVHPGIVVGKLQRRFNEYKYLRTYLVKTRHVIIQSTPHDGWGNSVIEV